VGNDYKQSSKDDGLVTLLKDNQVHLQPVPLLIFNVVNFFNALQQIVYIQTQT